MKSVRIFSIFILCLFFLNCTQDKKPVVLQKKSSEVKKDSTERSADSVKSTNAAQAYIDAKKNNIEKAKEAIKKTQKAQDDQDAMLKDIK